jgi:hypothetical protein
MPPPQGLLCASVPYSLTVVTNSVTAANTAQANATTIMGNNYNSLPSKLASINQSKQANATLLSEIL